MKKVTQGRARTPTLSRNINFFGSLSLHLKMKKITNIHKYCKDEIIQ